MTRDELLYWSHIVMFW